MDDLQERITTISNCLDNREPVTQLQVQGIVQRASALSSQVTAIVNDIGTENIDRQTIMMTRELKAGNYIYIIILYIVVLLAIKTYILPVDILAYVYYSYI